MDIQRITWQQTIPLRHRVLWPGKPPEYSQVDGDIDGLHFGAFVNDELVCVASIYLSCKDKVHTARLRKFATERHYQNQGIGSKMLTHIIQSLQTSPTELFWCDARESAVGFYQRFGMRKSSDRFYKADVAYYKMEVVLR